MTSVYASGTRPYGYRIAGDTLHPANDGHSRAGWHSCAFPIAQLVMFPHLILAILVMR